jgi:hypothetical protein
VSDGAFNFRLEFDDWVADFLACCHNIITLVDQKSDVARPNVKGNKENTVFKISNDRESCDSWSRVIVSHVSHIFMCHAVWDEWMMHDVRGIEGMNYDPSNS